MHMAVYDTQYLNYQIYSNRLHERHCKGVAYRADVDFAILVLVTVS